MIAKSEIVDRMVMDNLIVELTEQRDRLIDAARETLLFPSNPATTKLREAVEAVVHIPESGWRVQTRETVFGTMLETGIRSGLVIVLYRDNGGWRTGDGWNSHVHLPHQLYIEKLQPLVDLRPYEIVAVNLHGSEWVTLWSSKLSEISFL